MAEVIAVGVEAGPSGCTLLVRASRRRVLRYTFMRVCTANRHENFWEAYLVDVREGVRGGAPRTAAREGEAAARAEARAVLAAQWEKL